MTIFWLIVWGGLGGAPVPIHAGNFPSLEACQEAAQSAKALVVPSSGGRPSGIIFICVAANASGTSPPQD
jgi:hypothetical protein